MLPVNVLSGPFSKRGFEQTFQIFPSKKAVDPTPAPTEAQLMLILSLETAAETLAGGKMINRAAQAELTAL